ncbi:tRNA-uridine aminocarboxypropyltransferase [Marinomonas pollencensis]|uniref:tRNA-uridine aminocarboxypropyltransferase n=1 Tax=Marinomonas pollencensis TaxID=491954 RepID=A0A3E0DRW0_9GAMM|nr:tRNA-uridine aminocarboxypropyltransferase [Marinomonas pollencensis]REG84178.1 DTW domain-containing protein YfiP [Marinomonas pollencensis]
MTNSKRKRCAGCGFLQSQCVCHLRPEPRQLGLRIIVLQDPKEAKHAKNTVTLLTLALPQVTCIAMDDSTLLAQLQALDLSQWRLLYPSEQAQPIETLQDTEATQIEGVILIDATWRKAKRFYLSQPFLHGIKGLCFASPPPAQYEIRKSPDAYALSTLEACCYAIEQISAENMQPIRDFMVASIDWQWRHQPSSHKHPPATITNTLR